MLAMILFVICGRVTPKNRILTITDEVNIQQNSNTLGQRPAQTRTQKLQSSEADLSHQDRHNANGKELGIHHYRHYFSWIRT